MTDTRHSISLATWFAEQGGWSDAVLPDYLGGSVANLPATVLDALSAGEVASGLLPPIREQLLPRSLMAGAPVVVLIVIDGLSDSVFRRSLATGMFTGWPAHAGSLTSVFPSTTTAALTSLHHGVAPAAHGLAGYTLYLPAHRRVVNMIHLKPVDGGAFRRPAPDPSGLVRTPNLFSRLVCAGVDAVVVSHKEYANSPLTRIHSGQTRYRGHRTPAEFATLLLEETVLPGPRLVVGYFASLDIIGHGWGPESPTARLELALLSRALSEGLFAPLRRSGRDVAVVVTADHGHRQVPEDGGRSLARSLLAAGGLRHPPTGERRAMGLSLKHPENIELVREYVAESGVVLDVQEALRMGLYGPQPIHPEVNERVGDGLILARGDALFLPSSEADRVPMRGGHGSLTPEEMLVPLLAERFG